MMFKDDREKNSIPNGLLGSWLLYARDSSNEKCLLYVNFKDGLISTNSTAVEIDIVDLVNIKGGVLALVESGLTYLVSKEDLQCAPVPIDHPYRLSTLKSFFGAQLAYAITRQEEEPRLISVGIEGVVSVVRLDRNLPVRSLYVGKSHVAVYEANVDKTSAKVTLYDLDLTLVGKAPAPAIEILGSLAISESPAGLVKLLTLSSCSNYRSDTYGILHFLTFDPSDPTDMLIEFMNIPSVHLPVTSMHFSASNDLLTYAAFDPSTDNDGPRSLIAIKNGTALGSFHLAPNSKLKEVAVAADSLDFSLGESYIIALSTVSDTAHILLFGQSFQRLDLRFDTPLPPFFQHAKTSVFVPGLSDE
jgi:hypothetical protein